MQVDDHLLFLLCTTTKRMDCITHNEQGFFINIVSLSSAIAHAGKGTRGSSDDISSCCGHQIGMIE